VGELDHLLFTIDGQAICSLGKDIFTQTTLQEVPTFLSGLITGVRSFSHLLERELQIITVIGKKQITRVLVSPEYVIEPRVENDVDQVLLNRRLGKRVWEESHGVEKEPQRGICIGFQVTDNPFWVVDFPNPSKGFRLFWLREMAENFYTEFAEQIRNFDFNFDDNYVKTTIGWNGAKSTITTIDLGHPVFIQEMEATVIFRDNEFSISFDDGVYESQIKSDVVCSTAATLYTGLNHAFQFVEEGEGWMIVDFGGKDTIGSSLFVFGKDWEASNRDKTCILAVAVAKKDKYEFGGQGDLSNIMRTLREKARDKAMELELGGTISQRV